MPMNYKLGKKSLFIIAVSHNLFSFMSILVEGKHCSNEKTQL